GRTVAQWAIPPQRLGSDVARPAGAAGAKAGRLRAGPRRGGCTQRRLHRSPLRSATTAPGRLLLRYPTPRQHERWARVWHGAVGGREKRPFGLSANVLTRWRMS